MSDVGARNRGAMWAVWLLVPVAVTVLAALGSWWRARPKRALTPDEAIRAHADFLDALTERPRT